MRLKALERVAGRGMTSGSIRVPIDDSRPVSVRSRGILRSGHDCLGEPSYQSPTYLIVTFFNTLESAGLGPKT